MPSIHSQNNLDESKLIKNLKELFDLSEAVKCVLQMHSNSINKAIDQDMIPESAGQINITINKFYDDSYKVTISGNGVGLTKSEAEDLVTTINNYDEWPIAMFKIAGHKSGYRLYSNHREEEDIFGYTCFPSEVNPIHKEDIKDHQSDHYVDILGTEICFAITGEEDDYSISEISSTFRSQAKNIETPVVYELQENENTMKRLYFNFD